MARFSQPYTKETNPGVSSRIRSHPGNAEKRRKLDIGWGTTSMNSSVVQYFRCPERYVRLELSGPLSANSGYFRFGEDTLYGRVNGLPATSAVGVLQNQMEVAEATASDGVAYLPFDVTEVVNGLRHELYVNGSRTRMESALSAVYYFVRPILPVSARKHLQRIHLKGWDKLSFPSWPVDRTVDNALERTLLLSLRAQNVKQIPFIWFWPERASGCALVTHDVETTEGQALCSKLMDVNDSFGIRASFQIIPEERYPVSPDFLDSIRRRGFEVVVHDLNHDGHLFRDRKRFMQRVAKINSYGKQFGATGFRAGVLYRNQAWFDALDFEYDMSVPNVAHLDPQRGGCCTVMPYFVGHVLELPVTMTQDYTLFHILKDYSTALWEQQIKLIMEKHGLISVVIHPDYLTGERERTLYEALLGHLARLREHSHLWITTPGEVNRWWRQRAEMTIIEEGGQARIVGPGSERACLALASEQDGRLVMTPQVLVDRHA